MNITLKINNLDRSIDTALRGLGLHRVKISEEEIKIVEGK